MNQNSSSCLFVLACINGTVVHIYQHSLSFSHSQEDLSIILQLDSLNCEKLL